MVIHDQSTEQEISQFNQLADHWWNPNGPMKPLHHMNPTRLSYIREHCSLKNKSALDVGCGGGLLSEALAKEGADVTAIDLSADLIDAAKAHANQSELNIDYQHRRISEQAELDKRFDVVTCLEMLEHVDDPTTIIEQCVRCLKPGGSLFVSTINRHPRAFVYGIMAAEYLLGLLPMGTHHYKQFIKPSELNRAAVSAGLTRQHIAGLTYSLQEPHCTITKDLSINYIAHFTLPKESE